VHPWVQMLILTSAMLQTGETNLVAHVFTCKQMSGTNPEMEQQMEQERLAILEHPVVRSISDVDRSKGGRPGFRVSLWCQTARQNGHGECDCGGLRQGVPVCVSTTRTTLLACLQDLHKQVLLGHGSKCITACKALEAQRMAQDASSAGAPDALRTMMDLSQATKSLQKATLEWKNVKERADKINKEALELQELVEKAQEEVQRLKAQLHPKRARIEAQEEEEDDIENVHDWSLTKHRSEATRVQSRRNTTMGSRDNTPTYRTRVEGYLWHPRLGLIGWVAYWSRGHIDTAVHMLAHLITKLNINEQVQVALPPTTSGREVETNAKMVDLLKDAVTQMKRGGLAE